MFSVVPVFTLVVSMVYGSCPPPEDVYPCSCLTDLSGDHHLVCSRILSEINIKSAMYGVQGINIYSFTLSYSTIPFLSHDLFKETTFVEVELSHSNLVSLTDTDVAFEGLEESLDRLVVTNCSFMNDWNWSHLKNLKNLAILDFIGGDLSSVGIDIANVSHLPITDLVINRNEISWIFPNAFATFKDLKILSLNYNEISKVERSMLPNPATMLNILDLSYNKLKSLPADFLTNMPSLAILDLNSNQLLTLQEKPFSYVWEQLNRFLALNNPLRCDCRMTWMTKMKFSSESFRAVCSEPRSLKGRLLNTLAEKELWC